MMNMIITRNMKRLILPFLIILVLILSGCAEDGVNANEVDLSGYPSSVQDGTVSVEYYVQLMDYFKANDGQLETSSDIFTEMTEVIGTETADKYRELLKEVLEDHNEILLAVSVKPDTKADKEIDKLLSTVITNQLEQNKVLLKFANTGNVDVMYGLSEKNSGWAHYVNKLEDIADEYNLYD